MANVGQITANTASQTMLAYNNVRQGLLIKNRASNGATVYLAFGTGNTAVSSVTAGSFPLDTGEVFYITADNWDRRASQLPDSVQIIAASGSQDIRFIEF